MKKIIIFLLLFSFNSVKAIENIKIDNQDLNPYFNKSIKIYNYFTNNNYIYIDVKPSKNENNDYSGKYELNEMETDIKIDNYLIRVFKNYDKNYVNESYIKWLTIDGYNINFDKNIHEYEITINDEKELNINYELSNQDDKLVIFGNGNFNKSDNIIKIVLNDNTTYIVHAYKTIKVSSIKNEIVIKELNPLKKEIIKIIIITISCTLVFLFYHLLFVKKTHYHI